MNEIEASSDAYLKERAEAWVWVRESWWLNGWLVEVAYGLTLKIHRGSHRLLYID